MTVVFDMDDVLVNLNEAWVDYVNTTYNLNVKHESITEWDMQIAFPTLTTKQIFECLQKEDFWKTVHPTPFSEKLLRRCEDNDIDYYIVTAAIPKNFYLKYEHCFKKWFPFVSSERLVCCNNKKLIQCDIIVDDNPNNFCDKPLFEYPRRLLMDKPWNRNADKDKYNYRIDNLKFVWDLINEYEEDRRMKLAK